MTHTSIHSSKILTFEGARDGSLIIWDLSRLLRRMRQASEEEEKEKGEEQEEGRDGGGLIRVQARVTGAALLRDAWCASV